MKTIPLTPELAQYLAVVIERGNAILGEQSLSGSVEEIREALEQSGGAEIRIGQ